MSTTTKTKNTSESSMEKNLGRKSRLMTRYSIILAITIFSSGCVAVTDRSTEVSSISMESDEPDKSVKKGKPTAPLKITKSRLATRVASYGFLGRAPYICTPSGFGRTSGCFLRRG
ncbi:hypothetical protein EJ066_14420 [Mesorhizobium sp. M9A.F.Ca.ET.002.03.1.2]|nr:hypothetical protein EJ066_14420 [Mesorhizobium sp. M9A.F.Ca.ET.002.03.1.2]